MLMEVPENIARRLEALASRKGTSVGDLLTTLLDQYVPDKPPVSMAELLQNALEAGISSPGTVDTSARSREILNQEYAEYLKRRMNRTTDDDHHGQ